MSRLLLASVVGLGALACGARPHGSASPQGVGSRSCTVVPLERIPLETPAGMRIYSYPSTVDIDSTGAVVILDEESGGFEPLPGGGWRVARAELLGAIVRPNQQVAAVEAPVPAERIRGLRVASRGDSRWSVVFGEVIPDGPTRYWHGIASPAGWSPLEAAPVSDSVELMLDKGSLAVAPTGLIWTIPYRRPISHGTGRFAILRRTADGWTERTLLLPTPTYTSLVADRDHLIFALVHPDTTLRTDANSLFLHRLEGGRHQRYKVAASQAGNVHDPTLSRAGNGLLLSWLADAPPGVSGSARRAFVARSATGEGMTRPAVLVDSTARSLVAFSPGPERVMAVTVSAGPLGDRSVTFSEVSDAGVEERAVARPRFATGIGVAATDSTVVVTGGVLLDDARGPVWLELSYFRIRCVEQHDP